MHLKSFIKRSACCLLLAASTVTAFGQDLIANQAPIDRKLKAVDSVSLQRYILTRYDNNAVDQLYSSWNTDKAHCYAASEVPDSFRIDLRGFAMPTPSRLVTSRFGYRPSFRRQHKGLDIKVYTGDTIVSAFDGKVRCANYDAGGYGYYIVVRHDNGLETIYGHLSKHLVAANQEVKAGEPIGLGGNTGRSFGSHLHFETRLLGVAINPELLFDFPNQDVTADYFVFHNPEKGTKGSVANDGRSQLAQNGGKATHFYQVKRGDTLTKVAKKLGVKMEVLCRNNNLTRNSRLRDKQILRY